MDRYAVFVPKLLSRKECFVPEASISCKGCGEALAIRLVYKALESAQMHKGTWKIPFKQPVPELKGADKDEAAMPALLRLSKEDKQVLSICFDNEARTGKNISTEFWRKRMPAVAVAEGVSYVATASPGYPFDLVAKVKKACSAPGDAYLHILCPCPVGWAFDPSLSVQVGKLAVDSNLFPLYEVIQGTCFINIALAKPRPVTDYLRLQKRFQHLSDTDQAEIQKQSALEYSRLSASSKQGEKAHERH